MISHFINNNQLLKMSHSTFTGMQEESLPGTSSTPSRFLGGDVSTMDNKEESSLAFLPAVELHVFKNFVKNYVAKGELLREDAIALDYIFGTTIQHVLEIIEEEQVVIHRNQSSNRVVIEVHGQTVPDSYWILPGHSMCHCMSFTHGKKPYCKHILAAHLFLAITPKERHKNISDEEFQVVIHDLTDS